MTSLLHPHPPTTRELHDFLQRHLDLLARERQAEVDQTSLLASNCSTKLLERKGLAIGGLAISSLSIGLGSKTLLELHLPSAHHSSPLLPAHTFRNGDLASLGPNKGTGGAGSGKKGKGAAAGKRGEEEEVVEGVIYKVTSEKITLSLTPTSSDSPPPSSLGDNLLLLRLTNSATYDRMESTVRRLGRIVLGNGSAYGNGGGIRTSEGFMPVIGEGAGAGGDHLPERDRHTIDGPTTEAIEGGDRLIGALLGTIQPTWGPMPLLPLNSDAAADSTAPAVSRTGKVLASLSITSSLDPVPSPPTSEGTATNVNRPASPVTIKRPASDAHEHHPDDDRPRGITYFDEGLNVSQKKAVRFALTAGEVACIHGPPGTGKTYTLVEIIRQLVFIQGKRVLVCGASNLAVDNLLTRLSPVFPPYSLLRLGHPARITPALLTRTLDFATANSDEADIVKDVKGELEGNMRSLTRKKGEKGWVKGKERGKLWDDVRELRKEHRVREAKVVKNVVGAARVVLSTCHGAGSRQIANMDFDVCIIDEATQAVEPVCWVPILKSRKLILAGDPLQLPPTILSRNDKGSQVQIRGKPLLGKTAPTIAPKAQAHSTPVSFHSSDNEDKPEQEDASPSDDASAIDRPRLKPPATLEKTLFDRLERLYGPGIKRVLTVQYRMHESIASFPSDTLYDSLLVSHDSVAKRTLLDLPSIIDPTSEDSVDNLTPNVVFFDTVGLEMFERQDADDDASGRPSSIGDSSRFNENEAVIVGQWVKKLVELGVPPSEIAIVTPYQAQVAHILKALEDIPDLSVGSIDGMQGQEREAIVLSLVRSNATREVGFLAEKRRLNVAMTRAKRQLCVVGDSGTVSNGSKYLREWMAWLEDHADVRYPGQ